MQDVRSYDHIVVRPIAGMLGAEVDGVELSHLDDAAFAEVRQAFADHACLFFRDQHLSPSDIERFGAGFGKLVGGGYVPDASGSEFVQVLTREAEHSFGERNDGDAWHSDLTFNEQPSALAGLYSVQVPSHGGDTMFASMYAAFETLSPGMRTLCEQLHVIHSPRGLYGADGSGGPGHRKPMPAAMSARFEPDQRREFLHQETRHPLVVSHPVSGRKLLFISGTFAVRFDEMTEDESAPLIEYLYRHAQRAEFTVRWRWEPHQLGMWDNIACMHLGVQDYAGMRREMYRFEVAGGPLQ